MLLSFFNLSPFQNKFTQTEPGFYTMGRLEKNTIPLVACLRKIYIWKKILSRLPLTKGGVHSFVDKLVRLKIILDIDIPMGLLFWLV